MTEETEEITKRQDEEMEKLRDENQRLEERLQLQKTSWLYSHHLLLSICFGVAFGAVIGSLPYISIMILRSFPQTLPDLVAYVVAGLTIFTLFGLPVLAFVLFAVLLKAPAFAYRSWFVYCSSFFFFVSLTFYVDSFNLMTYRFYGVERFSQEILPFAVALLLGTAVFTVVIPPFAEKCGYRLVLDGSPFSFEVDADVSSVSKQLEKLEEDLNFILVGTRRKPDILYFEKRGKGKTVLQLLLRPKENKTDVVIVMHSIVNDIPMRIGYDEVTKVGEIIMKWLEVSKNFAVLQTENEHLVNEMIQQSKKSFYRQPVSLPSKKAVKKFFKAHWKDILIIVSAILALLSWLFPIR